MNQPYGPLRPVEPAPWLTEAARLSAGGLLLPDIAAALSQLGYSDMAIAFATAALRSDAVRAARRFGETSRPAGALHAPLERVRRKCKRFRRSNAL
jgi:hypothetical protein